MRTCWECGAVHDTAMSDLCSAECRAKAQEEDWEPKYGTLAHQEKRLIELLQQQQREANQRNIWL